ncbi:MAG TPA: hypothetical protein VFN35_21705 [Ktedonobacteraceae bacterium]|nr:hypothetical protein [Ktedonobacteraceae bacterium]
MPLDDKKLAHIQGVLTRTWAGRQKTVVFVYCNGGLFSYVAQSVLFRLQQVSDPQIPGAGTGGTMPALSADALMIAPISTTFTGVVFVADTTIASSSAVTSAAKYQILACTQTGMAPAGTRYVVHLRRLR